MMKTKDPAPLICALQAIAGMVVNETTDHAQLGALCMSIAKTTLQEWCCADAACYNESNGVACAILE